MSVVYLSIEIKSGKCTMEEKAVAAPYFFKLN